MIIYKICSLDAWNIAKQDGRYLGSEDDVRDGFIHFSAGDQLKATADKYFTGQHGLVLVAIDDVTLGDGLKWEPSRGGALFPHLYGALDVVAALWVKPLPLDASGAHIFPDGI